MAPRNGWLPAAFVDPKLNTLEGGGVVPPHHPQWAACSPRKTWRHRWMANEKIYPSPEQDACTIYIIIYQIYNCMVLKIVLVCAYIYMWYMCIWIICYEEDYQFYLAEKHFADLPKTLRHLHGSTISRLLPGVWFWILSSSFPVHLICPILLLFPKLPWSKAVALTSWIE